MSSASTNVNVRQQNPDFFEITNFSTNTTDVINLARYSFTDGKQDTQHRPLVRAESEPVLLGPGESAIFVRSRKEWFTNEAQFRAWWGDCLPTATPVRLYGDSPGLSSTNDSVRLYGPTNELVASVVFGKARSGVSFTYDTNGEFGVLSALGTCGACMAAETNADVGSPGVTCGPVPVSFPQQPTNQTVLAGANALLVVRVAGMPRPRLQWFFNGNPVPGATGSRLEICPILPENGGRYEVIASNVFACVRSEAAELSVDTAASPPQILQTFWDMQVFAGETAPFSVKASGWPAPAFQWFTNDILLPGETNRTLSLPDCTLDMSETVVRVQVTNISGSTNVSARLTVVPRPDLRLTEVMSSALSGFLHQDWFELTNFGTNAVDLLGWRFLDTFSLESALVVTEHLVVEPGESVIFAEKMPAADFIQWWGAENLPPGLKIFTYFGFGLSWLGDQLYFWNAAAQDGAPGFDGYSFVEAKPGISLQINTNSCPDQCCAFGCDSVAGVDGVFHAVESPDVGSPGYTAAPSLRFLNISREGETVLLSWRAQEGKSYRLLWAANVGEPAWQELGTYVATNATGHARDPEGGIGGRFYRVQELPGL